MWALLCSLVAGAAPPPSAADRLVADSAALHAAGSNEAALEASLRAYALRVEAHGAHHPATLDVASDLAVLSVLTGRVEEGVRWAERAWEGRRASLGERADPTLLSLANLAAIRQIAGDLPGARSAFTSLWVAQRATGAGAAALARTLHGLGVVADALGDHDAAALALDEALALVPPDDPLLAATVREARAALPGDRERSRAWLRAALEDRRRLQGPDHADVATTEALLAQVVAPEEAVVLLTHALATAERAWGPSQADTAAIRVRAASLTAASDPAGALPQLEQALHDLRAALGPDHVEVARAEQATAATLRALERLPTARALLEHAETVLVAALPVGHPDLGRVHAEASSICLRMAQFGCAITRARAAIDTLEAGREPADPEIQRIRLGLAAALRGDGQLDEALTEAGRVLTTEVPSAPHGVTASLARHDLAATLLQLGRWSEAGPYVDEALADLDPAQHPLERSITLDLVAQLAAAAGDLESAERHTREALTIRERSVPGSAMVARTLNNLGGVLDQRGRYGEGAMYLERSRALWKELLDPGDLRGLVPTGNLAVLYQHQGDLVRAAALAEEVVHGTEAASGADHPSLAIPIDTLASVRLAQGDLDAALSLRLRAVALRQALGADHPDAALSQHNLGTLLLEMGRADDAVAALELARTARVRLLGPEHPDTLATTFTLRLAEVRGGDPDLVGLIEVARRAAASLPPDHPDGARMLHLVAEVVASRGFDDEARAVSRDALAAAERAIGAQLGSASEHDRLAALAASRRVLGAFLLRFDRPEDQVEAWTASLRWKGAVRRAIVFEREARRVGVDPEWHAAADALAEVRLALGRAANAPVSGRDGALAALEDERRRLERELAAHVDGWQDARAALEVDPAGVCASLGDGEALVDLVRIPVGDEGRYLAWVVDAGCRPRRVDLGPSGPIERAVALWRSLLMDPDALTTRIDPRGAAVRSMLWDPLGVTAGRVFVSPSAELAIVPWAALPTVDGYLVEDHILTVVDHPMDLTRPPAPAGSGSLVVAASRGAIGACGRSVAPLPGARAEAERVARRLPGPVLRLDGAAATEDAVRDAAPGHRVVHLAAHGFVEGCEGAASRSPSMARAGVALVPGTEDGAWTAEEVSLLDLRGTDLVVLSSCASGLGDIDRGEGVLGLARAFSIAGARTLIVALAPVPDAPTARMLAAFYAPGGVDDPAAALAAAQRGALEWARASRGESRPQDWGTWSVVGQGRPPPSE